MYAQLNLKTDTKNLSCFSLFFIFTRGILNFSLCRCFVLIALKRKSKNVWKYLGQGSGRGALSLSLSLRMLFYTDYMRVGKKCNLYFDAKDSHKVQITRKRHCTLRSSCLNIFHCNLFQKSMSLSRFIIDRFINRLWLIRSKENTWW